MIVAVLLFVVATVLMLYASMFLKDRRETVTVECEKTSDSVSVPLTGEPESAHDIYDCGDDHGYVYFINNVEYSREGQIITNPVKTSGEDTITKEFIVIKKNDWRGRTFTLALLMYIASAVTFYMDV